MRNWLRVAHRGASAHAPENTLAAFRRAVELGADAVEMDVHLTADGHVVVIHDATLDRTTNGTGAVTERSLSDIRSLDAGSWFDPRFAGERIPTLDEAFDVIPKGVLAVVEVKSDAATLPTIELIRTRNRLDDVALISFAPEAVRLARWVEPRLPTSLLIGRPFEFSDPVANALAMLRAAHACGTSSLDIHWRLAVPESVDAIHRRCGSVWVWTVDAPEDIGIVLEADVDAVTSNYPDRLNAAKGL
jgi:glycerophosphoryl diester phosphodiesterase